MAWDFHEHFTHGRAKEREYSKDVVILMTDSHVLEDWISRWNIIINHLDFRVPYFLDMDNPILW